MPMPIKCTDKCALSITLTFSYLIGFSPFRVQAVKNGPVVVQNGYFRRIIFVCFVLGTNLVRVTEVRSRVPGSMTDWTPLFYFQLFCGLINIIFNLAVAKALFYDSDKILNIINFNLDCISFNRPQEYFQIAMKWICIGEILLGILVTLIDVVPSAGFSLENFQEFIQCTSIEGKYTIFLEPNLICNDEFHSLKALTLLDYVFAFGYCLMKVVRHIHGYYGELLLLCGVIALWIPASSFSKIVKDEHNEHGRDLPFITKFENLYTKYITLKQFSKLVNDAFGLMVLLFIIASVFYYSSNLDGLVITSNPMLRIRLVSFYISALITFTLAADVSHRVKVFDDWISDLPTKDVIMIPQNNLTIIVHELSSRRIGISSHIFTITYTFLANMAGVLMTYFIICVQFRAPWTDQDKRVAEF